MRPLAESGRCNRCLPSNFRAAPSRGHRAADVTRWAARKTPRPFGRPPRESPRALGFPEDRHLPRRRAGRPSRGRAIGRSARCRPGSRRRRPPRARPLPIASGAVVRRPARRASRFRPSGAPAESPRRSGDPDVRHTPLRNYALPDVSQTPRVAVLSHHRIRVSIRADSPACKECSQHESNCPPEHNARHGADGDDWRNSGGTAVGGNRCHRPGSARRRGRGHGVGSEFSPCRPGDRRRGRAAAVGPECRARELATATLSCRPSFAGAFGSVHPTGEPPRGTASAILPDDCYLPLFEHPSAVRRVV